MKTRFSILVCLLSTVCVGGAFAQSTSNGFTVSSGNWSKFLEVTCGVNCQDPVGERIVNKNNWNVLQSLGTLQFLGASANGHVLDPSAMLAASRVVGPVQFDSWLKTGNITDPVILNKLNTALTVGYGYNVSNAIGNTNYGKRSSNDSKSSKSMSVRMNATSDVTTTGDTSTGDTSTTTGDATGTSGSSSSFVQSLVGTLSDTLSSANAGCSPSIASAQNASGQSNINSLVSIITGSAGFTQINGSSVDAGTTSSSSGSVFGSSCLDKLMTGTRDILFKPPGLSDLLSSLTSMFSGSSGSSGSSGGCGNASSPLSQIQGSMLTGIFSNAGGFFPHLNVSTGEGDFDLGSLVSLPTPTSNTNLSGGFGSIYNRP